MSRSRNIKPGFFKNEELSELPFEFRILFQGLWCESDREGRLEDRPKRLKAEVFPYDNVDVEAGLRALSSAGFIVRYEVEGRRFIEVQNFLKHQNPHKREAESSIPAMVGPRPVQAREIPEQAEESQEPARLIPDSLIPDSLIPQEKQERVQPAAAPSRFAEFWAVYPNPKAKKVAKAIWDKRKLDSRCDELIAHVRLMVESDDDWRRGYVPMGSTYLNQDRWEDVPKQQPRAGPVLAPPSKTLSAIQTLQSMKSNGNVDSRRDSGRPEQAALLGAGAYSGR